MFNRRVPKCHPRIEACGGVDELNAAIGMARATAEHEFVSVPLLAIQQDLIILMGELATVTADRERYWKDGFKSLSPEMTVKLDVLVKQIESEKVSFKGWATPGATVHAAALDVARTICRRAERSVSALREAGELENAEIGIYLNRLSDALWLLARWVESRCGKPASPPEIA
jgi:cob(I)alamin adenosyltransferase